MKNQYFGDINDYRKYGLLRVLQQMSGLSIGICWCLTEDDGGGHGEIRGYLRKPQEWRRYDPELYDKLQQLNEPSQGRSVGLAREWDLIPGASYFDALLGSRPSDRMAYFAAARMTLQGCELVFLDPDIGIEVPAAKWGRRGAESYIYWRELKDIYAQGQSILVYQHFPRVPRDRFISFLAARLGEELAAATTTPFQTPHVAFFLVQQPRHVPAFTRAEEVVTRQWPGQFVRQPPFGPLQKP